MPDDLSSYADNGIFLSSARIEQTCLACEHDTQIMYDKLARIESPDEIALHLNSDIPAVRASRHAAVLIPLVQQDGQWHILFIRRASNDKDRHSGQVAFPGGRIENDDSDAVAAALRETQEEIGVADTLISVIGNIGAYITISRYEVTPVVGIIDWPTPLVLQDSEVARAFLIPLDWLRDRNNFTFRARQDMDPQSARRHPIIVYEPFDGETLWGATARMTLNFLRALDDGDLLLPGAVNTHER